MAAFDSKYPHRLSVAPMMGVTDKHWRHLARLLSKRTLLYSEMVVDSAIVHNADALDHTRFLGHRADEHPGESKRYSLGKLFPVHRSLEAVAEVDVKNLAAVSVEHEVARVAIAEAEEVPDHGHHG